MKRALALLILSLMVGCSHRVTLQKPDGSRVVVDDRVVDIVSERSLADTISEAPDADKAALIREWIASKERLATAAMINEDKRTTSFWNSVIDVLKITLPVVAGYYIGK